MTVPLPKLKNIVEAALLAAGRPLKTDELIAMFDVAERPDRARICEALDALQTEFCGRGIALKEVASGFRIQVKPEFATWVARLWEDRPARYSRAFLETLSLIAYRQPVTRGEIESVRGVAVNTQIMRTLQERGWIRIVGHRDVPGHPAMFGTTREFLDYFNLKSLDELPTLAALRDLGGINAELDFDEDGSEQPAPSEGRDALAVELEFAGHPDDGILPGPVDSEMSASEPGSDPVVR